MTDANLTDNEIAQFLSSFNPRDISMIDCPTGFEVVFFFETYYYFPDKDVELDGRFRYEIKPGTGKQFLHEHDGNDWNEIWSN